MLDNEGMRFKKKKAIKFSNMCANNIVACLWRLDVDMTCEHFFRPKAHAGSIYSPGRLYKKPHAGSLKRHGWLKYLKPMGAVCLKLMACYKSASLCRLLCSEPLQAIQVPLQA